MQQIAGVQPLLERSAAMTGICSGTNPAGTFLAAEKRSRAIRRLLAPEINAAPPLWHSATAVASANVSSLAKSGDTECAAPSRAIKQTKIVPPNRKLGDARLTRRRWHGVCSAAGDVHTGRRPTMNKPEFLDQRTANPFKAKYGNFIGGRWIDAVDGQTFRQHPRRPPARSSVPSPARPRPISTSPSTPPIRPRRPGAPRSPSAPTSSTRSPTAWRTISTSALAETWDNGKADPRDHCRRPAPRHRSLPLFRRRHPRRRRLGISEIDHDTIAYHFHEPLGVVGQIIPWNFRC